MFLYYKHLFIFVFVFIGFSYPGFKAIEMIVTIVEQGKFENWCGNKGLSRVQREKS